MITTPTADAAVNAPVLSHVTNRFSFTLPVAPDQAAPLFGPEAERLWAGADWNPQFIYPQPAADVEGAVFTLPHGTRTAIWVNTVFDPAAGRMQYVYVLPDILVTTIDVRLIAMGPGRTRVDVTYVRTALTSEADATVVARGKADAGSGPQWQAQIEAYLAKRGTDG